MRRFFLVSALLALALLSGGRPCRAAEGPTVTLQLDRLETTLSEAVKLTVEVSGSRKLDADPVIPGLEVFTVTPGGTSSRMEIINGRRTSSVQYNFLLEPRQAGLFHIGPAECRIDGQVYQSNAETLKVVRQAAAQGAERGPLFMTAALSKTPAYVEEPVLYIVKLFVRVRIGEVSLDLPKADHLKFKQLEEPRQYESGEGGQRYQVLEARYLLTPSQAGEFNLAPARMRLTVYDDQGGSRRRTIFDDPFFSRGRPQTLLSEPVKLKVLPLPVAGQPRDFSGLIGTFKISSKLEPAEVQVGGSATLTVRLSGRGNVSRLPDLSGPAPSWAKVYADQPVLKVETDAEGQSGVKTMKWALVPQQAGEYEIPSLGLSYFDPAAGRYRTLNTEAYRLKVRPGAAGAQAGAAGGTGPLGVEPRKQEVQALGQDILPVHTGASALAASARLWPPLGLILLGLLTPAAIYALLVILLVSQRRASGPSPAIRARRALGRFAKTCRQGPPAPDRLKLAVRDFLNDRLGYEYGAITPDEAAGLLTQKSVRPEIAQRLKTVLERLDSAIYAGLPAFSPESGREGGPVEELIGLIRDIDREL